MTNMRSTKRALLTSTLAILVCVSMLVGTTFAWFTDTASTAVNKIQAGTLDVALEMLVDGEWVNAEGQTLAFTNKDDETDILWEPGCTYVLPNLRVVNNGNLALKFSLAITGIDGEAKLNEVIDWKISYPRQRFAVGEYNLNEGVGASLGNQSGDDGFCVLTPGANVEFVIKGHMQETAGNEYQGLSIDGIGITVYATQTPHEYDSFDRLYDSEASVPSVWDGKTVTAPTKANGVYQIKTASEFAWLMAETQNANSKFAGETFVLDRDLDFNNRTITGVGGHKANVEFTFDGNGHTISNFVINGIDEAHKEPQADGSVEYRYAALFQQFNGVVKNLTVKNATVIGNQMVGVIAANVDNAGVVDNCKVYDSTVIGAKKVAAVVGYVAGTNCSVTNCYAENCNVYATDERVNQSNAVIGYVGEGATISGNTSFKVNVYRNVTLVSTAADLREALVAGGTVVLTNDLDMNNAWTTVNVTNTTAANSSLVFDGLNHKITNLNKPLIDAYGLNNLTVNNVTVDASNVVGNSTWSGCAALVQSAEWCNLYMNNCHVKNTSVTGNEEAGTAALVGYWVGGGEVKNSSVVNCTIASADAAAALVGHRQEQSSTGYVAVAKIADCKVEKTSVSSTKAPAVTGETKWRVGTIIATVSNGEVQVEGCEVVNSTVSQPLDTNPGHELYGRISGGTLVIDGIAQ